MTALTDAASPSATLHMNMAYTRSLRRWVAAAALLLAAPIAAGAQTEFHYQYGKLTNPFSGTRAYTSIVTVQQASSWALGDSFVFVDILDDGGADGFNDKNFYGEWYPTLSLGKLSNRVIGGGPVRDVAFIGGINIDGDAKVLKYLPGARLSWDVPGFVFLHTDLTAFIDASSGAARGGAPRTSDSFMFDVSWGAAFDIGRQSFWFTGHAEYIGATTNEFGDAVKGWILAQPQLGWDVGKAATGATNQLFLGVEYQYWRNKFGAANDDNVAQLWVMWRL